METVVLIPAYKPSESLLKLIDELTLKNFPIVVVNDGSGDDFATVFEKASEKATVLHQNPNQGKGAALKLGIKYIEEQMPQCQFLITADADGQHTVKDISRIAEDLAENGGFVIGARKFEGKVPLRSRFGNSITKLVFMVAAGKKCNDTQTGLRGFSRELFSYMSLIKGNRYEYEMNVLMQTAQDNIPIREIPIETVYENNNESSHFNAIKDSYRIYKTIILNSALIKYGLSAVFCFILDFSLLLLFNHVYEGLIPTEWIMPASVLSTICARVISSPINYLINRNWVFRSNADKATSFISYIILAACVLLAKSGLMYLLEDVLQVHIALANIAIEVILFISNFIIQKLFIFRKSKS